MLHKKSGGEKRIRNSVPIEELAPSLTEKCREKEI